MTGEELSKLSIVSTKTISPRHRRAARGSCSTVVSGRIGHPQLGGSFASLNEDRVPAALIQPIDGRRTNSISYSLAAWRASLGCRQVTRRLPADGRAPRRSATPLKHFDDLEQSPILAVFPDHRPFGDKLEEDPPAIIAANVAVETLAKRLLPAKTSIYAIIN